MNVLQAVKETVASVLPKKVTRQTILASINDTFRQGVSVPQNLTDADRLKYLKNIGVCLSLEIMALSQPTQDELLHLVTNFTDFDPMQDFTGEHRKGSVFIEGTEYLFRINYSRPSRDFFPLNAPLQESSIQKDHKRELSIWHKSETIAHTLKF